MAKVKKLPLSEVYHIEAMLPFLDEEIDDISTESPYRIIAVRPDMGLYELGISVLEAFDFASDHMFGYYDNFKSPYRSKVAYEMEGIIAQADAFGTTTKKKTFNMEEYTVRDIFTRKGKRWLMLFDYGDEWPFWLKFVNKEAAQPKQDYPYIVVSEFEAPEQYPDFE